MIIAFAFYLVVWLFSLEPGTDCRGYVAFLAFCEIISEALAVLYIAILFMSTVIERKR